MSDDPFAALSPRHRLWVIHYIRHNFNASAADRECGYKDPGKHGHQLLKKPEIKAAISQYLSEHVMTPEETLYLLSEQARASILDVAEVERDAKGNIISVTISKEAAARNSKAHLIKEVSYDRHGRIQIKLHDSQSALQLLARHHGLLKDSLDVNASVDGLAGLLALAFGGEDAPGEVDE